MKSLLVNATQRKAQSADSTVGGVRILPFVAIPHH